ncbi:hypothetical protein V6N12_006874 [Hibiscus sabdariffa]|uniref:Uncharacterized protein n=1 Tax=Hibiscus sabdariffa TaxID=183260 RepID=A0ABR2F054_9ROSI
MLRLLHIKPNPVCRRLYLSTDANEWVLQGLEGAGGGERSGIEGIVIGIEGMLGRGGKLVGKLGKLGSGGIAPGFGNAGIAGIGGKEATERGHFVEIFESDEADERKLSEEEKAWSWVYIGLGAGELVMLEVLVAHLPIIPWTMEFEIGEMQLWLARKLPQALKSAT